MSPEEGAFTKNDLAGLRVAGQITAAQSFIHFSSFEELATTEFAYALLGEESEVASKNVLLTNHNLAAQQAERILTEQEKNLLESVHNAARRIRNIVRTIPKDTRPRSMSQSTVHILPQLEEIGNVVQAGGSSPTPLRVVIKNAKQVTAESIVAVSDLVRLTRYPDRSVYRGTITDFFGAAQDMPDTEHVGMYDLFSGMVRRVGMRHLLLLYLQQDILHVLERNNASIRFSEGRFHLFDQGRASGYENQEQREIPSAGAASRGISGTGGGTGQNKQETGQSVSERVTVAAEQANLSQDTQLLTVLQDRLILVGEALVALEATLRTDPMGWDQADQSGGQAGTLNQLHSSVRQLRQRAWHNAEVMELFAVLLSTTQTADSKNKTRAMDLATSVRTAMKGLPVQMRQQAQLFRSALRQALADGMQAFRQADDIIAEMPVDADVKESFHNVFSVLHKDYARQAVIYNEVPELASYAAEKAVETVSAAKVWQRMGKPLPPRTVTALEHDQELLWCFRQEEQARRRDAERHNALLESVFRSAFEMSDSAT
ncbi:hypothetical protein [Oleidesulfovibrio sp.]|uniref:hypothetical protein n=1 Tax=Oleidesulfovibrio sp. TaxID=2909707 RepID=UPI003A8A0A61